MSDELLQEYKGQSFDKAIARYLGGNLIASGYEPRDRYYQGRFWWGIQELTDGTMEVICGRVSTCQYGAWGYKIDTAERWGGSDHNPPLNVRKAIVKHGLRVKGVYNPDSDDPKFALMLRGDLLTKVSAAILSGDDTFLLEAIAHLGSDVARTAMAFFHDECCWVGRNPPRVSTAVLRAIAANADATTAKFIVMAMRDNHMELDATVAQLISPLLDEWRLEQLAEMFPEASAQQAA